MKEGTARIGDGRTDGRTDTHDRTGSECFPSRWPEINKTLIISEFIVLGHHGAFFLNYVDVKIKNTGNKVVD